MRHRGPDDEGLVAKKTSSGKNLYLLHSRLSIIDLDRRARQPFERGNDLLCYNGEVYNYRELRERLSQEGSRFQTESDTEVLSELLRSHGMAAISACEGMWAFAWFDGGREELHLCRDRFGEKPLYVFQEEGGLYFGSEPKFIFAMLGRTLPVNVSQVKRYLVNGYKSLHKDRNTFFEGMFEIAPGSYRSFSASATKESTYWRPNFETQDDSMSYSDAVSRTREALVRSVELRLRADVPVAFLLSGGIDSNALASIAKRELGYDVHGFTIMSSDARYEERQMVETAVTQLGLKHKEVKAEANSFAENLRELVRYHDSPVSTISFYAHSLLVEAIAAEGYRVSISGTGADELFSGYFDHHNAYLADMKVQDPGRYLEARANWEDYVSSIVRNPFLQDPDYFVKNPESRGHIYLGSSEFAKSLRGSFSDPFREQTYSSSLLRNRMANELLHESVPVMLREDDLNSMFHSIENRSPFLDTGLFEVAQATPTRHLVQNGRAKSVLREAVRGLAPESLLNNPRKVGFNLPLRDFYDISSPVVLCELLADSPIFDIVQRQQIEKMLSSPELSNSKSKFLFSFLNAKLFLEEFAG